MVLIIKYKENLQKAVQPLLLKLLKSLQFSVSFNYDYSLASSAFSLSVDVSSPDLFGSFHEDFSLTSVSKIPNTESKVCHVKGNGCGNQPKSLEWKASSHVRRTLWTLRTLWDYVILYKDLCVFCRKKNLHLELNIKKPNMPAAP